MSYGRFVILLVLSLLIAPVQVASEDAPSAYPSAEDVEPLAVGTNVPSVDVRTVAGEAVNLAERVHESGALLVFYRGGW